MKKPRLVATESAIWRRRKLTRMSRSGMSGLVVAIALVAGACGDDAEALTKEEYIEQANAICAASNAQAELIFEEVTADLPDEPTPQQVAEAVVEIGTRSTPIIEAQLDDLRALRAPEGDEDTLAALFDDVEAAQEEFIQLAEDAAAGDQAAFREEDPFADVDQRAIQYGLTVCGS